jgi:hypothetical protein
MNTNTDTEIELLNYLKTLAKIQDIKTFLHFDNILLKDTMDLEQKCLDKTLEYKLVKLIIKHNSLKCCKNEEDGDVEKVNVEADMGGDSMKNQIHDLTNLLGGEQEIDIKNFDPKVFDTFGRGIGSLFNIKPAVEIPNKTGSREGMKGTLLIKNENNITNKNNNFTFEIKKRHNE